jgi:hypothetical protein
MSQPGAKVSLIEMAEVVGDAALSARMHVVSWNLEHPDAPLHPTDPWVLNARCLGQAQMILSIMALDEDASRKFVGPLMATADGKILVTMLTQVMPKGRLPVEEAEAA